MQIKAVVYQSATGHTKRYAQMFAAKTGLPLYTLQEAKKALSKGDEIIYFGWILSGKIQGFEPAWTDYEVKAVASVGLYPDSARFRNHIGRNNIIIDMEYFHLRGGIKTGELKGGAKILMKIMMKTIEKKLEKGQQVTPEELEMHDAYKNSADFVSEEQLAGIYAWYDSYCADAQ